MADSIQMRVTRYTPGEDAAPRVAEYSVPLRKDWAVLDGLNYIKDHLDSSLSYRWSCRMGICGSCGMNVQGEPQLTCAHLPQRLCAWAGPGGAADELPGRS